MAYSGFCFLEDFQFDIPGCIFKRIFGGIFWLVAFQRIFGGIIWLVFLQDFRCDILAYCLAVKFRWDILAFCCLEDFRWYNLASGLFCFFILGGIFRVMLFLTIFDGILWFVI